MARAVDQLLEYQNHCVYDYEDIAPVRAMLCQDTFIHEFRTFAEDLNYTKSYELEPKRGSVIYATTTPLDSSDKPIDLLTLSAEEITNSLQISKATTVVSSLGDVDDTKNNDVKESNKDTLKFDPPSGSLSPRSLKKTVLNWRFSHKRNRSDVSSERTNTKETSEQIAAQPKIEKIGIFDSRHLLREALVSMRHKTDANGNKVKKSDWEQYFVRLFPGCLYIYPKKLISATSPDKPQFTKVREHA